MASRKVETAVQEVALAAFYENGERAAQQLKQVPAQHAAALMEGSLRVWAMTTLFVEPKVVGEVLARYGLGIVGATNQAVGEGEGAQAGLTEGNSSN